MTPAETRALREGIVCERRACRAALPSPRWWNTSTRAYYCEDCKDAITSWPENAHIFEDRAARMEARDE